MRQARSNDQESVNEMQLSDDRDQHRQTTDATRERTSTAAPAPSKPHVRHAWRSLVLGWTDPESGDELTMDVRGGAEFARGLAGMGFEILAEPDPGADQPARPGAIEVVAHRRPLGTPRPGADRRIGDRSDKFAQPMILRGRRSTPPN